MLRAIRVEEGNVRAGGREVCESGARLWVDLSPDPENLAWLRERFGFHPLALEDCAQQGQRPKFEEYPEAHFCVVHRLEPAPDDEGIQSRELHAFLTGEALVTVHLPPVTELDRVYERCAADPTLLSRGVDFALYLLYDAITDVHFAVADALTDEIEELATEVSSGSRDQELVGRILQARRVHGLLRRALAPQREVMAALARGGERVSARTAVYFRDVQDHLLRITDQIDVGRELLASAMEVQLSLTNNRLSEITARLTLVATIFLPLNFLAGFFGMNLEIVPAPLAKGIVLAALALLPGALWLYFRRRGLL